MASQLSSIGAAATGGRLLSTASRAAHSLGKGLEFAGHLEQSVLGAGSPGGALAQLAAAIQSGTPLALIANQIAGNLAGALNKAAGNQGNPNAQSTLARAMASALAPPGTSPPGSGTEQAAILQQRLASLVSRLVGEANNAGQQSEFSGTVLDANSARETPAQQTKSQFGGAQAAPDAVSSYVQSLLNAAASNAAANGAAATPASLASLAASASAAASNSAQTTALPDILTRMLARAASADAQRNGEVIARAVPEAAGATTGTQHVSAGNGNSNTNAAALFERLIAIVAEEQSASQNGSDSKGQSQGSPSQSQGSDSTTLPVAAQTAGGPAFTSQVQNQTASAAPYSPVDPNAVIEQLVKGISMRSSGSSSEVQLRLQPEHLGNVALKLTVVGNTINANIVAQTADVRDMLLANQQHLVRSLAEAGLSLGKFSVDVSGGNTGFTQQQSQQQAQAGRSISAGGSLLSNEDETWEDQRFGPAISSGSASLVFNYLA
ncbi:MAG TPA: flagellar hook-length control protein FliK [Candidatus Baltobacteraceae bacterium]|jgi:flagellar hook-length control protein FliK|nr:flagellar hook-length control protein FliK [Candidatus Baltobacteraceae bacterium]